MDPSLQNTQPGYPSAPQQPAAAVPQYQQPMVAPQQPQAYAQPAQPQQPQAVGPMGPINSMNMMPSANAAAVGAVSAPEAVKAPASNPNSTQNTLQIAEIRDGIVIMNDGSFRSVVMVKSINFDLMSLEEQEAVESGYQGFLNSLYFPIQIFIRSQKVDLGPYIEKLDKIRTEHDNMLLAVLMEDYIGFMSDISSQTNIMDKRFYVVIPYFPVEDVQKAITNSKNFFTGLGDLFSKKEKRVIIDEAVLEQAKTELRNRVQAILGGLMQCGVQGLPLDTQELIELFYDTYNPDTATRQPLKNFNDLSAPIITKGVGVAPQAHLERGLQ